VIAEGTPEQLARNAESATGHFLAPILERASRKKSTRTSKVATRSRAKVAVG
jgi:Excinuclease ATPase subunit